MLLVLLSFLQKLEIFAFDLLNGVGDFIDISNFLFRERRPDVQKLSPSQLKSMVLYNIIQLIPFFVQFLMQ